MHIEDLGQLQREQDARGGGGVGNLQTDAGHGHALLRGDVVEQARRQQEVRVVEALPGRERADSGERGDWGWPE